MSSSIGTRRHRADENPQGRPAPDLVKQYSASARVYSLKTS